MAIKMTEAVRAKMRARYLETTSLSQTARELGCSTTTVHRAVRDLSGIGKVGRPRGAKTRRLTDAEREAVALALLYGESTGSVPWRSIADRAGCSVDELRRLVVREARKA